MITLKVPDICLVYFVTVLHKTFALHQYKLADDLKQDVLKHMHKYCHLNLHRLLKMMIILYNYRI